MASKFDKLFDQAPQPQAERQPIRPLPDDPIPARHGIGRPPGKRSDPAWKLFSVILKKQTQFDAQTILRAKQDGSDLSTLVQTLLDEWVKKQKSEKA